MSLAADNFNCEFQSTPSVGRATVFISVPSRESFISIHALRGEGDLQKSKVGSLGNIYFNPRPPWGGRLICSGGLWRLNIFQSTPSVGRATLNSRCRCFLKKRFQSTPSVGRATKTGRRCSARCAENFNPRPPWGGRHRSFVVCRAGRNISIHALRGEGDGCALDWSEVKNISIHALRGEGDVVRN